MKLRLIILVLAFISFISVSMMGYFYYSSLQISAVENSHREARMLLDEIRKNIDMHLKEHKLSIKEIAGLYALEQALLRNDRNTLSEANFVLDHYRDALKVDVCYLMDSQGNTIASSNRNSSTSFIGKNYAFRPYFQQAIAGNPSIHMALAVTSKTRGIFFSHPVYSKKQSQPLGVVVIKDSIEYIKNQFQQNVSGITVLKDDRGVIFVSSREDWLFNTLWKVSPEEISEIKKSQQFGDGPWMWTGMERQDADIALQGLNEQYYIHQKDLTMYPGWKIVYLHSEADIFEEVVKPLMMTSGLIIIALCVLYGMIVGVLCRLAMNDISKLQHSSHKNVQ